jgi:hypothetical protein
MGRRAAAIDTGTSSAVCRRQPQLLRRLLLAAAVAGVPVLSQDDVVAMHGGATCGEMTPFCIDPDTQYRFEFFRDNNQATTGTSDQFGCLRTHPGEQWLYLTIEQSGALAMTTTSTHDHDYALYGPFGSVAAARASCGALAAPIDCGYSTSAIEQHSIPQATSGDVYILLLTNYAQVTQDLDAELSQANTAIMSCVEVEQVVQQIVARASAAAVYAWGRYTSVATTPAADGTPTLIASPGAVLGGGARHLVAAAAPADSGLDSHTILTVGSNTYQQLGVKSSELFPGVTFAADNLDLVSATTSPSHCVVGSVFDPDCAALGMDACSDGSCIPFSGATVGSRLGALATAQVSAGEEHTLLLTTNGEVWGWGRNLEGQLGSSATTPSTVAPSQLSLSLASQQQSTSMGRAVYVGAGHFKSAVVTGGRLQLTVSSEGQLDNWSGGGEAPAHFGLRVVVELAGVEVFPAQAMRGHVVVVLDEREGTLIEQRQYNTHDADDAAARELVDDIAALPDGRIVIVATAESGTTHIDLITETLRGLGATASVDPGEYGSFALVGVTGYSGEQWVLQASSASAEGPTTITGSVPLAGYPGPSEVWACGLNAFGELGRGEGGVSEFPSDGFELAESLSGLGVVAIEFGREHAAVLTGAGALYGLGSNEGGQLGVGTAVLCVEGRECTTATPIQSRGADGSSMMSGIEKIATGDHHTLALASDGRVYCTGLNAHGECGLGHRELVDEFTAVPGLSNNIVAVAAGGRHSLALSSTGAVYGWGWNYHGQLGQQPDGANGGSHFVLSAVEMDMGDVGTASAVAAGDLYSAAVG